MKDKISKLIPVVTQYGKHIEAKVEAATGYVNNVLNTVSSTPRVSNAETMIVVSAAGYEKDSFEKSTSRSTDHNYDLDVTVRADERVISVGDEEVIVPAFTHTFKVPSGFKYELRFVNNLIIFSVEKEEPTQESFAFD